MGVKQGGFGMTRSILHQRKAQDHGQRFGHGQMPALSIGRSKSAHVEQQEASHGDVEVEARE
jgi:hypothetical protein